MQALFDKNLKKFLDAPDGPKRLLMDGSAAEEKRSTKYNFTSFSVAKSRCIIYNIEDYAGIYLCRRTWLTGGQDDGKGEKDAGQAAQAGGELWL